jgi:hypothetical protein
LARWAQGALDTDAVKPRRLCWPWLLIGINSPYGGEQQFRIRVFGLIGCVIFSALGFSVEAQIVYCVSLSGVRAIKSDLRSLRTRPDDA